MSIGIIMIEMDMMNDDSVDAYDDHTHIHKHSLDSYKMVYNDKFVSCFDRMQ